MSNESFLSGALSHISASTADIDEKIERLMNAKQEITADQSLYMGEIKKILEPSLHPLWDGKRGKSFDESRQKAFDTMESILENDYEDRIRAIDMKISSLKAERAALNATKSLVDAADNLLQKGEEAVEELGRKISEISRRLFG